MNNPILPLTSPQILTEAMFQNYGFFTGSATHFQIQVAFSIAENQCATAVGTFLAPTIFTGNQTFLGFENVYQAPVGKIHSIPAVIFREQYGNGLERLISGTAVILDSFNGYYVVTKASDDNSVCGDCDGGVLGISTFDVVMQAGYETGTIAGPNAQLALCMAADIVMKQMYDEGIATIYENMIRTQQVGRVIQSFETKYFYNTIFGPSSRANYIMSLLTPYMIVRAGKLG